MHFNGINTLHFLFAILGGLNQFTSGAPLNTDCAIPSDLNIHYDKLATAVLGKKFLTPTKPIPASTNNVLSLEEKTCPNTQPTSGPIQDRSNCPWYYNSTVDDTLYPSTQKRAVCRCRDCIGADGLHECQPIYSEIMYLKRTSVCLDGLFVYEPKFESIPTGCVCAMKKIAPNNPKPKYDV